MELHVFLAVLAAAMMHAGWNAVVKGGTDPFTAVTQVSLFSGGIALCLLPFVSVPAAEVWPWLAASAAIHTLYRFMLIGAYRAGDMTQVYPIMRGAAPLMTAVATALLIGERVSAVGFAAIIALSIGVFLMSLRGGRVGEFEKRAVVMALLSAASTCGYTLTDGLGARVNGSGPGYALWMFVLNAATMQSIAIAMRGRKAYDGLRTHWPVMAGGGSDVHERLLHRDLGDDPGTDRARCSVARDQRSVRIAHRHRRPEGGRDALARVGVGVRASRHAAAEVSVTASFAPFVQAIAITLRSASPAISSAP